MAQPYPPQGYAPQQYAQPAPQQPYQPTYGAPQGTPWLPPQFQQQPAGPVGGQALPTTPPPLGQSARTGGDGPKAPAPRHLVGRTVIFEPISIDEDRMVKNDKTGEMEKRPMARYHLTVVDGGPLQYGDNQSRKPGEAHGLTLEVQTPARFLSVSSDRFGIVNEVRDALACGEPARVGVVVQGTRGNFPFLVTKCARDLDGNDRPDGAQRFEAATLVWNQIFSKTFTSPEPRSLVAAPTSTPPQVQYQPVAPAQGPTYGTAGGAPQYVMPVPAQYATYAPAGAQQQYPTPGTAGGYEVQPTYAQEYAAQTTPGFQTPYAAAHPGTGPYGDGQLQVQHQPVAPAGYAQQQYAQTGTVPTPYGAAPAGQLHPEYVAAATQPPVNPAFEAWLATLPPEQQAAQRAAMAPQPQPAATGGPGF